MTASSSASLFYLLGEHFFCHSRLFATLTFNGGGRRRQCGRTASSCVNGSLSHSQRVLPAGVRTEYLCGRVQKSAGRDCNGCLKAKIGAPGALSMSPPSRRWPLTCGQGIFISRSSFTAWGINILPSSHLPSSSLAREELSRP